MFININVKTDMILLLFGVEIIVFYAVYQAWIVIMGAKKYILKMQEILFDQNKYAQIQRDPTITIQTLIKEENSFFLVFSRLIFNCSRYWDLEDRLYNI